jgi:adenosylcobinamide-GDP ribazoletransferase
MIIAAALSFWYYYVKTKKELGGITGDTAGYFVCICECAYGSGTGWCLFYYLVYLF